MKPLFYIRFFALFLLLQSCANKQFLTTPYQGDVQTLTQLNSSELHALKPNDKLTISIWDHDNLSVGSLFSIYNSNEAYGKWIMVDSAGFVLLPQIGKVKAEGLNCQQFADSLRKAYGSLLVNPIIVVKVLNWEVTVLGEVKSPGNFIIEKEHNQLYEFIGKAEGVTPYANLKNVQLIRKDTSYSLNLKKDKAILSINLQAGDLLVFTPKKGKVLDQKAPTIIPFASAFTAFAVFFSVFKN